ncbi:MAG TPA: hypothetical protein VK745_28920, partial [Polyangiaceae bacterium]|nr:hypothetical protein [Polyangiaceae bacterium]
MTSSPDPDQETPPRASRALRRAAFGVVGACVLLLTASFIASQRATGRAMAGVRVAELDVSRLTRDDVQARLRGWSEQRARASLAFSLTGASVAFEPKSAGFRVDVDKTTERVLEIGRQGGVAARFIGFIARWFRPEVVDVQLGFDAPQLAAVLDDWQAKLKDQPFAGGVSFDGTTVTALY